MSLLDSNSVSDGLTMEEEFSLTARTKRETISCSDSCTNKIQKKRDFKAIISATKIKNLKKALSCRVFCYNIKKIGDIRC